MEWKDVLQSQDSRSHVVFVRFVSKLLKPQKPVCSNSNMDKSFVSWRTARVFCKWRHSCSQFSSSDIDRSAWYFEKWKSSKLAKSVPEDINASICNSALECVACSKCCTYCAVIPGAYHFLALPVLSRYSLVPKPEIATPAKCCPSIGFHNLLFEDRF